MCYNGCIICPTRAEAEAHWHLGPYASGHHRQSQWQTWLHACVKAKGRHFEHLLWFSHTTGSEPFQTHAPKPVLFRATQEDNITLSFFFHCNILTTAQDIQDYASLIFLRHSVLQSNVAVPCFCEICPVSHNHFGKLEFIAGVVHWQVHWHSKNPLYTDVDNINKTTTATSYSTHQPVSRSIATTVDRNFVELITGDCSYEWIRRQKCNKPCWSRSVIGQRCTALVKSLE